MSLRNGEPRCLSLRRGFPFSSESKLCEYVMKCRCPSDTHGHKAGKCQALAVTPDNMCQPCHDKVEQELAKATRQSDKSKPSLKLALAFVAAALVSTAGLAQSRDGTPNIPNGSTSAEKRKFDFDGTPFLNDIFPPGIHQDFRARKAPGIAFAGASDAGGKITLICQGTMSFVNPIVGRAVKTQQQPFAQSGLTIDMDGGQVTWGEYTLPITENKANI